MPVLCDGGLAVKMTFSPQMDVQLEQMSLEDKKAQQGLGTCAEPYQIILFKRYPAGLPGQIFPLESAEAYRKATTRSHGKVHGVG